MFCKLKTVVSFLREKKSTSNVTKYCKNMLYGLYNAKLPYAKALELSGFSTLYDRREVIISKLLDEICNNQFHCL